MYSADIGPGLPLCPLCFDSACVPLQWDRGALKIFGIWLSGYPAHGTGYDNTSKWWNQLKVLSDVYMAWCALYCSRMFVGMLRQTWARRLHNVLLGFKNVWDFVSTQHYDIVFTHAFQIDQAFLSRSSNHVLIPNHIGSFQFCTRSSGAKRSTVLQMRCKSSNARVSCYVCLEHNSTSRKMKKI